MKTRKRTFKKSSLLLAVVALAGLTLLAFGTWVAAAPGAAPSAQVPGAPMAPLPEATCTLVGTTRTCELWALPGTIDLPGAAGMPIWGFGTTATGPALVPGPIIRATVGETLEVVLYNQLPGETISLAFPGQAGLVPDMTGVPTGGTTTYSFSVSAPGTFLYEAGLTSGGARQVAMGLAGPLIVDDGMVPAWDEEVVLVFSEIDPSFNINPSGFSMNGFRAKYWLINGQAYPDTGWIEVVAGSTVLMRYLNAGVEHHTLGLLGLDQSVVALDGAALPFAKGAIAPAIAPGQTLETLVAVPLAAETDTLYPLYNASLHQHNNNQRLADGPVAFGGMLTYLRVTAGGAPVNVGPVASNVAVAPQKTDGTVDVVLSATLTDVDGLAAYEYYVDDPSTATVVLIGPTSPVDVEVTFLAADVATWGSGEHVLYIRGQDAADPAVWGTLGSAVLNLDMAGPDITGLSLAPNPTNGTVDVVLTGTADDSDNGNSNVLSAEYSVDGGATWLPMTLNSPNTPLSGLTATLLAADVLELREGVQTVIVRALDDFGNLSVVPGTIDLGVDQTGPDVPTVTLSPSTLDFTQQLPVTSVRLTASLADPLANGVQSPLVNAEGFLYVQGDPGTGFNLYPSDGLFNEITEDAYYNIPVAQFSNLAVGVYEILVVGKDEAGNWGAAGSADLTIGTLADVDGPTVTGVSASPNPTEGAATVVLTANATDTASIIAAAEWFVGADPGPGNGTPMNAANGLFDSLTEALTADIDVSTWADGDYTLSVRAIDGAGNWGPIATTLLTVFTPPPVPLLYFSTVGNAAVPGVPGPDDADIYTWDGALFDRMFDASVAGLPGNADIDALAFDGGLYYMSFNRDAGTTLPIIGVVQDEDVVLYDAGTWTLFFDGTANGLGASAGQDLDAIEYP